MSAEEAFKALGIDRSTGYSAIRNNTFPVPIIRVGRLIRVPTAALRKLLLMDEPTKVVEDDADTKPQQSYEPRIVMQYFQLSTL